MRISNDLHWDCWANTISLADLVGQLRITKEEAQEKLLDKLEVLLHLNSLFIAQLAEGATKFDWDKGHNEGLFSVNDYSVFPQLEKYKEEVERAFEESKKRWTENFERQNSKP